MGVIVVEDTHGFVLSVNANVNAIVQVQLNLMEVNVSIYQEKTMLQEYVVIHTMKAITIQMRHIMDVHVNLDTQVSIVMNVNLDILKQSQMDK